MAEAPLQSLECETGGPIDASVIWLHGLGADGHDFEPIVPALDLGEGVRFIFPHAPHQPVTLNGGMVMRAWRDIVTLDAQGIQDEPGTRSSGAAIRTLVEREEGRGIDSRRIVLAGFSQGGALALYTGLRYPRRLAGLVGLSTYMLLPETLEAEAHAANRDTPIFMAHGRFDPIVPYPFGRACAERLERVGYGVEWHDYSMEHAVVPEEIEVIGAWLRRRLQRPPD